MKIPVAALKEKVIEAAKVIIDATSLYGWDIESRKMFFDRFKDSVLALRAAEAEEKKR